MILKLIQGWPQHRAGDDGCIYSKGGTHRLKPQMVRGYETISLAQHNTRKHYLLHRLIAEAFLGPRPEGLTINHIDGNKRNNKPENLEYITNAENLRHAHRNGLIKYERGQGHHNAKLTDDSVREIRSLAEQGLSQISIAARFGITPSSVSRIASRKTWGHI